MPDQGVNHALLNKKVCRLARKVQVKFNKGDQDCSAIRVRSAPGAGALHLAQKFASKLVQQNGAQAERDFHFRMAGMRPPSPIEAHYRAPHHTVSRARLYGSVGCSPRPGELALSHGGVLILHEGPEFPTKHLELIGDVFRRQTIRLENKRYSIRMPAAFHLIYLEHTCLCEGGYGSMANHPCRCKPAAIDSYHARQSYLGVDWDAEINI